MSNEEAQKIQDEKDRIAKEVKKMAGWAIMDYAQKKFIENKCQTEPHQKIGRIFVRCLDGKCLSIESVLSNFPILYLKRVISIREGTPVRFQRLIFAGKQMEDELTVGDYKISNDSTVHLVLRLAGC